MNKGYTVRESQGKKAPFHLGQGKSGKHAIVMARITFSYCRSGKDYNFDYHVSF